MNTGWDIKHKKCYNPIGLFKRNSDKQLTKRKRRKEIDKKHLVTLLLYLKVSEPTEVEKCPPNPPKLAWQTSTWRSQHGKIKKGEGAEKMLKI